MGFKIKSINYRGFEITKDNGYFYAVGIAHGNKTLISAETIDMLYLAINCEIDCEPQEKVK